MTHFENLIFYIPDLQTRRILDVGAGKGKFVIDCATRGVKISGIEYNLENVLKAKARAKELGITIDITQGEAEHLQFPDASFGFLNFSEVIEHVRDTKATLKEAYRVLKSGGEAYVSAPSRYSLFDPHFHIIFVNWIPRASSDGFIRIFGNHKKYDGSSGHQRLSEMHYYTLKGFVKEATEAGFKVEDMRALKIKKLFKNPQKQFVLFMYYFLRPWYFRAFHFKLTKK